MRKSAVYILNIAREHAQRTKVDGRNSDDIFSVHAIRAIERSAGKPRTWPGELLSIDFGALQTVEASVAARILQDDIVLEKKNLPRSDEVRLIKRFDVARCGRGQDRNS